MYPEGTLRIHILVAYSLNVDSLGIIGLQARFLLLSLSFSCTMWLQSAANLSAALSSSTAFARHSHAAPATRKYQSYLHVYVLIILDVHYLVDFLRICHMLM